MAIYAPDISVSSRGSSASSVASAAYMSRSSMTDERTGERYSYERAHPRERLVADLGVELPEHAPERFADRSVLWNEVERSERRADAQVCRKMMIPLPAELTEEQNTALARAIVADRVADGHVVDACVHSNVDGTNPHLHMMEPLRPTDDEGFRAKSENVYLVRREGDDDKYVNARELKRENAEIKRRNEGMPEAEKEPTWEKVYLYRENGGRSNHTKAEAEARGLDPVHDRVRKQPVQKTRYLTDWNDRDRAEIWRGQWAERINEALEDAGHDERVDHRSYARQGIEREPMRHEGPKVTAIERQEAKRARKEERAPEPATDVRRDNVDLAALNQRVAAARAAIDREWDKLARDVREAVARAREGFRTGIDRARDLLRRSLRRPERAPAGQTRAVYREQERERARRHHGHSAWDRDRAREAERRHAQEQEQKRRREREKRKERPQQRERGTGRSWSPPREDAGRDYGPTIGRGR